MEIRFILEKETKGAFMFTEVDEDGKKLTMGYVVGSLYVRKEHFTKTPREVTITLTGEGLKVTAPEEVAAPEEEKEPAAAKA